MSIEELTVPLLNISSSVSCPSLAYRTPNLKLTEPYKIVIGLKCYLNDYVNVKDMTETMHKWYLGVIFFAAELWHDN